MGNYCSSNLIQNRRRCSQWMCRKKILRIVKDEGMVLEFKASILVKDLLLQFHGYGVAISRKDSRHLPPEYKLKLGHSYYLVPSVESVDSTLEERRNFNRVKLVLTKQQLQDLLSKNLSMEYLLSRFQSLAMEDNSSSVVWLPKLETIPEGNEWHG